MFLLEEGHSLGSESYPAILRYSDLALTHEAQVMLCSLANDWHGLFEARVLWNRRV